MKFSLKVMQKRLENWRTREAPRLAFLHIAASTVVDYNVVVFLVFRHGKTALFIWHISYKSKLNVLYII